MEWVKSCLRDGSIHERVQILGGSVDSGVLFVKEEVPAVAGGYLLFKHTADEKRLS